MPGTVLRMNEVRSSCVPHVEVHVHVQRTTCGEWQADALVTRHTQNAWYMYGTTDLKIGYLHAPCTPVYGWISAMHVVKRPLFVLSWQSSLRKLVDNFVTGKACLA